MKSKKQFCSLLFKVYIFMIIFSTSSYGQLIKDMRVKNKTIERSKIKKINAVMGVIDESGFLTYEDESYYHKLEAGQGTIDLKLSGIPDGWNLNLYLWNREETEILDYSVKDGNADERIEYDSPDHQIYIIEVYCVTENTSGWGDYSITGTYTDPPYTDLIITSINPYPNPQWEDETINVNVVVKNQGEGKAFDFSVDIYYNLESPPYQFFYGDDYETIYTLDVNDSKTVSFENIDINCGIGKTWNMYAYVDVGNFLINEKDEDDGNNWLGPVKMEWRDRQITDYYGWPLENNYSPVLITSVLNEPRDNIRYHNGIDIRPPNGNGTSIYTVSSGLVSSFSDDGMGVQIGGFYYYHLGDYDVDNVFLGNWINEHQFIGKIAEDNHVHFCDGVNLQSGKNPLRDNGIWFHANTSAPKIYEIFFVENGEDEKEEPFTTLDPSNLSG